MKTLTAEELKKFSTKEENIKLMKTLFEAIVFSEIITNIVDKKAHEILAFYKFESEEVKFSNSRNIESEVILKPEQAYRLKEADFNLYFAELNEFYNSKDCPVKPTKNGNCPALEAQSLVRNIKIQIADFFAPTLHISYDQISGSSDFYKKYYNLLMRVFATKIKL